MSNTMRVTVILSAHAVGLLDALSVREMPNGKKYGRTGAIHAAIVAEAGRLGLKPATRTGNGASHSVSVRLPAPPPPDE